MSDTLPLIFWAGEKLLIIRSLAKRRRERIEVLEELLRYYRADYGAAFKRCRELINRVKELENQIDDAEMSNWLGEILG